MRTFARFAGIALTAVIVLVAVAFATAHVAARLRETGSAADIAPASGRFISTARGNLYVQEAGPRDGPAVVLVHGTAVWSEAWRPTMDALALAGFRAIAFDVPPFGFSDRPALPAYSRADQAGRVVDLLDALSLDRAIVVAHSIGARGPMEAALRAPERLRGLVLVCGALGLGDSGRVPPPIQFLFDHPALFDPLIETTVTNPLMTKALITRLLARKEAATDDFVAMMQKPMPIRGSTHEFGRWLAAVFSPDPSAKSLDPSRYATINMPVALIWGEKDIITPLAQAHDIAGRIPNATLDVIADVGHVPQVEDFDAFRTALLRVLQRMD